MSNTNTDDTKKNDPPVDQTPGWASKLTESLGQLGDGMKTLIGIAKNNTPSPRVEEPAEEPVDDGSDLLKNTELELLPRKQFAEALLESFEGTLQRELKPLQEALNKQGLDILTSAYTADAQKFAEKTPDFAEWSDEMMGIAEKNPQLSVSRIYAIARAENPAKAVEMAKKYEVKKEENVNGKRQPLALTPGSGSGEVKNQRMNVEDAGKAAWEESVAKFGNPFSSG